MLAHVLDAVARHPRIGRVIVLAQRPDAIAALIARLPPMRAPIHARASGDGISRSIARLMRRESAPLLITTADNPLLTADTLDAFIAGAAGSDIAVGLVARDLVRARYPASRRTWLRFARSAWSGANLFWIGSEKADVLVNLWQAVEADRKKGWKVIAAFGPVMLLGAACRLLTIDAAMARVGRRFGLVARHVALPDPEACIDVDTPADFALVEAILQARVAAPVRQARAG